MPETYDAPLPLGMPPDGVTIQLNYVWSFPQGWRCRITLHYDGVGLWSRGASYEGLSSAELVDVLEAELETGLLSRPYASPADAG